VGFQASCHFQSLTLPLPVVSHSTSIHFFLNATCEQSRCGNAVGCTCAHLHCMNVPESLMRARNFAQQPMNPSDPQLSAPGRSWGMHSKCSFGQALTRMLPVEPGAVATLTGQSTARVRIIVDVSARTTSLTILFWRWMGERR
jgi:hypothetical protein